jgi:hypothetical protein
MKGGHATLIPLVPNGAKLNNTKNKLNYLVLVILTVQILGFSKQNPVIMNKMSLNLSNAEMFNIDIV